MPGVLGNMFFNAVRTEKELSKKTLKNYLLFTIIITIEIEEISLQNIRGEIHFLNTWCQVHYFFIDYL